MEIERSASMKILKKYRITRQRALQRASRTRDYEQGRKLARQLVFTIVNLEKQCMAAGYDQQLMMARKFAMEYATANRRR